MKQVLFVCTENKKRSQLAAAIFNHYAKKAKAQSAGTAPTDVVDHLVSTVLKEVSIVPSESLTTKMLTDTSLDKADLIISFGCMVSSIFPSDKFQEWHIDDPKTIVDFRVVRDILDNKIKILIKEKNF